MAALDDTNVVGEDIAEMPLTRECLAALVTHARLMEGFLKLHFMHRTPRQELDGTTLRNLCKKACRNLQQGACLHYQSPTLGMAGVTNLSHGSNSWLPLAAPLLQCLW